MTTLPDLILLHGALGCSAQLEPLATLLSDRFSVHLLDFEGHGAAPDRERPFTIEHFAENVRDYMHERGVESANFFGYSMGGFVACRLALGHPHAVKRIATLGTVFFWDKEVAAREAGYLNADKIEAKAPHFARALEQRHTALGWGAVVERTREMLLDLGRNGGFDPDDASQLTQPVRVMLGDLDTAASLHKSYDIVLALQHGELEVLPSTPHPIEKVGMERLARSLIEFFTKEEGRR